MSILVPLPYSLTAFSPESTCKDAAAAPPNQTAMKICKVVKADPTNLVMKKLLLALFFATVAVPLAAQTKTLLNLDNTGLATPSG